MIKFVFMFMFIVFIIMFNNIMIFYYNLWFFGRLILICIYIFKDFLWINIFMNLGIEYYSIWLIILRGWILGLMFMRLERFEDSKIVIFILLFIILLLFFLSIDLFIFYLIFEVRIIPTFFLIIYWGVRPERINAVLYLIIYILFISFPLLVYIYQLNLLSITTKFNLVGFFIDTYILRFWGYSFIFIAFYIKLPIYIFHIWLPKAHVEAPVYGSIILAGVLLKIGGYGAVRFLIIFTKIRLKFNYWILRIGVVGRFLVSILCLVQIDIKILVAYSSVVHMNIFLCILMTLFKLGVSRAYLIIVSHGLCSSGIFYIVNLYYLRSGSRMLMLNKGSLRYLPFIAFWWFIFCICNFSFPFSIGFIREIIIVIVILSWDLRLMYYLILICFFSRAYSLYLYSYIQHGVMDYKWKKFNFGLIKEYLVMAIHLVPLVLLLLNLLIFRYLSSLNKTLICGIKNI